MSLEREEEEVKISSPSQLSLSKELSAGADDALHSAVVGNKHKFLGSANAPIPRTLLPRHLTFVALGGSLGTGIFLSLGTSVATAGAAGALLSYIVVGAFCLGVILSLGEMSALLPLSGAFSTFGTRFVSPALGFALGWSYWLQWCMSVPSELIAAAVILQYWTSALQEWQWYIVIIVPVFAFQLLGTRAWGESEYVLALIKVVLIILFIFVGLIYNWGGLVGHRDSPGLSNFRDEPFYGGFAGFVQSCTYAFYSFGGVELVALAAGEASQPHKSVPRAIKATFARIIIFYVLVVLVIGLNINHNDPTLFDAYDNSDVSASPITTVFKLAGFGAAVHVVNAVLLTAVLSATNACFFASSRMIVSMARDGKAPRVLGWTTRNGVPLPALLGTLAIACIAFVTSAVGSGRTFSWLLSITGILALVTWLSISITNIRFRLGFVHQQRPLSDLPFRVRLFPALNILVLVIGLALVAANGWAPTTYGSDTLAVDEVAVYIGVVYFGVLFIGYALWHKLTKQKGALFMAYDDMDFESGAVWGRGGGQVQRDADAAAAEALRREKGTVGAAWNRVKESVY